MNREFCTAVREGPLTIVTLNRPDTMNALHTPAHFELDAVFDEFAADSDQWVAIVTGAGGRAFCAGNDLKFQAAGNRLTFPPGGFGGLTSRFDLNKPIIAAVNGVAYGGGFEIALACDIVVATDTATFALPEPKVGVAALAGGLHRLPRQIGLKQAMGLILTGRKVSSMEGARLGFVNEVTSGADLMLTARRWAEDMKTCSPMSIRASKEAVLKGLAEPSIQAAIEAQLTYPAVRDLFRSEDFREGPRAFAERRAPMWKND
ncbi:MAG TPA: enoyl-CoA hydratase-related protein [Steroidobacteraceae bacterium]|jgi:crotonobetainyl-CoA hydratase